MELQKHLFSVTELNQFIKNILEESFYSINLEGEISNFSAVGSGHWYFTLKDNNSSISSVMFKNSNSRVNFLPTNGMKVKIRGKLTLYSQRGTYQIVCDTITLFGEGDLLMMLEERKRELASLGYFDPSKKQRLPRFPKVIGIVASPTSAALQDILKVLKRRHSYSNILILPTLVQGKDAHKTISAQISKANRESLCDLIIVARGGGSIEDLLPFSEVSVVKEIYKSVIPIISGIGHEIDTSLSDLAADVRAATPSAAAEIATDASETVFITITNTKNELISLMNRRVLFYRNRLKMVNSKSEARHIISDINSKRMYIDNLHQDMLLTLQTKLNKRSESIKRSKEIITSLSPYRLFDKGYSWATVNSKNINDQDLNIGDEVEITYKNGKIKSQLMEKI